MKSPTSTTVQNICKKAILFLANYALVKVRRDDEAVSPSVVHAVRADATGCDDADASLCPLSLPSVRASVPPSARAPLTSDLTVNRVTFDVRES